jgi:hypothetical protein
MREPMGVVRYGGREGRYDDVVGWGFSLVVRDMDGAERLSDDQRSFLAGIGCSIVTLGGTEGPGVAVEMDDEYERYLREHGIIGYLSRPDFRLFAGIRRAEEIPSLVDDLQSQLLAR